MAAPAPAQAQAQAQTYRLPHLPPEQPVHVALYEDVTNSSDLKRALLAGDGDYEYAFIDAGAVLSTRHLLAAIHRAVNDDLQGRRRSTNVHSEIVLALSPNNNIAEAFRRFGLDHATKSLIVVKVSNPPSITQDSVDQHLKMIVHGAAREFSDTNIRRLTDMARMRKNYPLKLDAFKPKVTEPLGHRPDEADQEMPSAPAVLREMELAILGIMALRGAS